MWADFLSHFTEIGQLEEATRMQEEVDKFAKRQSNVNINAADLAGLQNESV
jgi:hypothetical protein